MAKIILGPIVQSVRGSIGGVTFRKVGAKYYANPKSAGPVNPGKNSGDHMAVLKTITTSWLELDPAVRQFWTRYHALATPRNPRTGQTLPTPYSLYLCYQSMRLHCGAPILTDSVPDPPIFAHSRVVWQGPFTLPGAVYEGTAILAPEISSLAEFMALFCSTSKSGLTPSRFVRKIFPTPDYGPGYAVANLNYLVYDKFGYPPGLSGLSTQPAQDAPEYVMSGWGLYQGLIWYCPWTPPTARGTIFAWPPALPIINP